MTVRARTAAALLVACALVPGTRGAVDPAGAVTEPGGPIVVDRLTDGAGRCGAGAAGTCTLRGALRVAEPERPTTIQLAAGILLQTSDAPFLVHGSVEVRGAPGGTVIVAGSAARIFELAPGATLRLVGLRVEGGDPDAPTTIGPGRLELRDVIVGDRPGSTASPDDLDAICGPAGGGLRALPVASAEVSDPLGARSLPGAVA